MRPALHPDHATFVSQKHLERFVAQPSGKLAGKVTVLLHLGDSPPVPPRERSLSASLTSSVWCPAPTARRAATR